MAFKITIKQNPLEIEFEAETIREGVEILEDSASELSRMFAVVAGAAVQDTPENSESGRGPIPTTAAPATTESDDEFPLTPEQIAANEEARALGKTGPGRPKLTDRQKAANAAAKAAHKGLKSAPVTQNPPPPAPVTASAPPPIAPPGDPGPIPPSLVRTAAPPPPAPPPAAASPIAQAVVDNLKMRKSQTADNGAALLVWLQDAGKPYGGFFAPGATFEEAMAVLPFIDPAKLAGIATSLGVAVPA